MYECWKQISKVSQVPQPTLRNETSITLVKVPNPLPQDFQKKSGGEPI